MASVKGGNETRSYVSPRREEAARQTRRAVLTAAAEHFRAAGYAATSLAQIAESAGVARPTVTTVFGSKCALLKEALDEALAGDDDPVPVAQRPWFRPVVEARDREELFAAYAHVCTVIGSRAALLFEAARRAADVGEDTRDLWRATVDNRRRGAAMVIARLEDIEAGRWAVGTPTAERATDALWLLNDPAHYLALVLGRGWSEDEFSAWLGRQFETAVNVAARQAAASSLPHASARSISPSSSGPSLPAT
ncbi:helix-turn-helix domain-containing protein [Sinomonas sp. ASV486]|uniref:TetR/AcrR family transcriptional regulator n=1 Tax=Sinomonas sp. ASV486 TaxID=3051170 RepID=UPI0027DEA435|nr:helix-turn-helix domain-containing protein [Sinomonas sp. ASV486]MDQ4489612.1 helix-turn-helix domain-containing protein [Sinomonas sp. ASV486]